MIVVDRWLHLARRFAASLWSRPPSMDDEQWALGQLLPAEQEIWRRLSAQDRRHAVAVARRVEAQLGSVAGRPVMAGALLHDCGKLDAGLGTFGRVAATLVGSVAGRRAEQGDGRVARYLRHEPIGAELLTGLGSDAATVALVGRTADADVEALAALRAADDG